MKIKAGAWTRLTAEQKVILLMAYARDKNPDRIAGDTVPIEYLSE